MSRYTGLLLICCFVLVWGGQGAMYTQAESSGGTSISTSEPVDTLLLDQYPNTYAAYSLRKLGTEHSGPIVRVRRGSDGAEQDFGFTESGRLDVRAVESWLSGGEGFVTIWYSQVDGEPDLVQTDSSLQPRIAEAGSVFTDTEGRIALKFDRARNSYMTLENSLSTGIPVHESLIYAVGQKITSDPQGIVSLASPGNWGHTGFTFRGNEGGGFTERDGVSSQSWPAMNNPGFWAFNYDSIDETIYSNNSSVSTEPLSGTATRSWLTLGVKTKNRDDGYEGFLTEVAILPGQATESGVLSVYDNVNADWELGPLAYNPEAMMPQQESWQITLYDWLETVSVQDVTLSDKSLSWDGTLSDVDQVADLWLQLRSATVSRVVNSEPEWYVLNAGNGKGIEATDEVRIWHDPGYGSNDRSWSNEPAFLYQLSVPKRDGTEGNAYKGDAALGRRALVVAMVDMMMYMTGGRYTTWTDMHGKALLGWAETYRWCKDLLPPDVQTAYEKGMERSLDLIIRNGARGVNTNMDMFPMHAAAEIYAAAEDPAIKEKALKTVKRVLLGSVEARSVGGPNHTVYAAGDHDGGVFAPAGYIMEGDQADVFYNGESYYHLLGAYSALLDRETGDIPSEWSFLEEILQRMSEWKAYQMFYDPGRHGQGGLSETNVYTAGAGFSGRTSAGEPANQASRIWRDLTAASVLGEARYLSWRYEAGGPEDDATKLPSQRRMEQDIDSKLSELSSSLNSIHEGQPPEWTGWSPWTKATTYLPTSDWYSRLSDLQSSSKSSTVAPIDGTTGYNKALGGPPTGNEFWAYKSGDASPSSWGFFLEADARQGGYAGWYGGKIETFWTEDTGIILMNRHGKSGCDDTFEDSVCWDNLDSKAGHHVWGRDENGNGFTTLLLRGRDLARTSTFNTGAPEPSVSVTNIFNDPSHNATQSETGEQTGNEIEGSFEVENTFGVRSDGLSVTHELSSDGSDRVNELWATIPVYLRAHRPGAWGQQMGYENTSIEYWDGSAWAQLPEDVDGDGTPERESTTALRLGRDFELGRGTQYAYIEFASSQTVRRSKEVYSDPYQTRQMFRSVHIDLHGDPGATKPLPREKRVRYTVQTTDPTASGGRTTTQSIPLEKGWNLVSTSLAPSETHMDSIFADLQSDTLVVENERGQQYRPATKTNEIGHWDPDSAYLIYVESNISLTIRGMSRVSRAIALDKGWNWVPYLGGSSRPVEEATASIGDELVMIKNNSGESYIPGQGVNSLRILEPGKGYKVYVKMEAVLEY